MKEYRNQFLILIPYFKVKSKNTKGDTRHQAEKAVIFVSSLNGNIPNRYLLVKPISTDDFEKVNVEIKSVFHVQFALCICTFVANFEQLKMLDKSTYFVTLKTDLFQQNYQKVSLLLKLQILRFGTGATLTTGITIQSSYFSITCVRRLLK